MIVLPMWVFLIVAIIMALVIGRLGTVLKDKFSEE